MSTKTIVDNVKRINEDYGQVAYSTLIPSIQLDVLVKITTFETTDKTIKAYLSEINKELSDFQIGDLVKEERIYKKYIELLVYYRLKYILKYDVVKIPETDTKTPDFQIKTSKGDFYIEVKSLSVVAGHHNDKAVADEGLDIKVDMERQLKERGTAIGEFCFNPFDMKGSMKDYFSITERIEVFNTKLNNNYKKEQFTKGDTLLFVDLSQLSASISRQSLLPVFWDDRQKSIVSGELWQTVFGTVGDQIYKYPEFEGKSNLDTRLPVQGFLLGKEKHINGIVFQYSTLSGISEHLLGLVNSIEDNQAHKFIWENCKWYNDFKNSYAYDLY
jgi:hypothetical protein